MHKCLNPKCESLTKNPKFCSRSCSVSQTNKQREQGKLRSKLERWIEPRLEETFPNLEFEFNKKSIGSELDIYCPSIKYACELNGSWHYHPIHGEEVLRLTQENDKLKVEQCQKEGVKLRVLDVRGTDYITPKKGWKYLRIIIEDIEGMLKNNESSKLS